jgi:hypothetical protein
MERGEEFGGTGVVASVTAIGSAGAFKLPSGKNAPLESPLVTKLLLKNPLCLRRSTASAPALFRRSKSPSLRKPKRYFADRRVTASARTFAGLQ